MKRAVGLYGAGAVLLIGAAFPFLWMLSTALKPSGEIFATPRLVPLHPTAQAGLDRYLAQRRPYAPADNHVFVSLHRKPLLGRDVITAFRSAIKYVGLPRRSGARPTAKSLRHTFATRALQTCPDGRDAVTRHMVALSTYLGHKSVAETYWYLEAVPDLMRDIADRVECLATGERP